MKTKYFNFIFLFATIFLVSSCCEEQNWFRDADGDGFGDANDIASDCDAPAGYVADNTDTDDTDANIFPGCTEVAYYTDADGDGFGDANATAVMSCVAVDGSVANNSDIDDTDADLNPNTVWQGPTMTFTKADGADFTLEANQDRITDNVWITRGNIEGLFNIKTETEYADFSSPADTEWAEGRISDGVKTLTYAVWETAVGQAPPSSIGKTYVVHLITDDIYLEITPTSWASGGSGGQGGFSYDRSTKAE